MNDWQQFCLQGLHVFLAATNEDDRLETEAELRAAGATVDTETSIAAATAKLAKGSTGYDLVLLSETAWPPVANGMKRLRSQGYTGFIMGFLARGAADNHRPGGGMLNHGCSSRAVDHKGMVAIVADWAARKARRTAKEVVVPPATP